MMNDAQQATDDRNNKKGSAPVFRFAVGISGHPLEMSSQLAVDSKFMYVIV